MSSRYGSLHPRWRAADSSFTTALVFPPTLLAPGTQLVAIPAAEMADKLGSAKAANIVMMGALLEETECLAPGTALCVLEDKVKKLDLLEIDRKALSAGRVFIDEQAHIGAVSQPDGFA